MCWKRKNFKRQLCEGQVKCFGERKNIIQNLQNDKVACVGMLSEDGGSGGGEPSKGACDHRRQPYQDERPHCL